MAAPSSSVSSSSGTPNQKAMTSPLLDLSGPSAPRKRSGADIFDTEHDAKRFRAESAGLEAAQGAQAFMPRGLAAEPFVPGGLKRKREETSDFEAADPAVTAAAVVPHPRGVSCAVCLLTPNQVLWSKYEKGVPVSDKCRPCEIVKDPHLFSTQNRQSIFPFLPS
jgi:hypothetical protein